MVPFFRAVRVRERGREATLTLVWGTPPFVSFRRQSFLCLHGFGQNLEGMILWPSRTVCHGGFAIGHQGAELLSAEGEKMGVLAVFGDF